MSAARDQVTDELHEVFHLYDEDGSGTITLKEFGRAMYTVTGDHMTRLQLVQLVTAARARVHLRRQEQLHPGHHGSASFDSPMMSTSAASPAPPSPTPQPSGVVHSGSDGGSSQVPRTVSSERISGAAAAADAIDGIDLELFEQTVLMKLHDRSEEQEQRYAFSLLEDQYYPGFITKDSLARAAVDVDEPLTDVELNEMFHHLVTGVPTAAVDYTTFAALQEAAQLHDGE
ncbi:caltractin [Strigomonas culicis]|uniref:Caltractin n=1 Tax=Strigomonas culicis TaxID=28005 RepID=S9USL9_9TRYP|nr:caltractin [Strigomonas culicis]|eukprot:EPY31898.1 caltractin [Strigomonas culicis]